MHDNTKHNDAAKKNVDNSIIIKRLFGSFTDLEQAIDGAKVTLSKKESVPPEVMERLNSYDGILLKQRNLARALCEFIATENWDEVNRHVSLINGLSAMIRDDARAILNSIANDGKEVVSAKQKELLC